MSITNAVDLLRWFAQRGGGKVKLFGGEPLLVPDVARAAIDFVALEPRLPSINLCSNGALLDDAWMDSLESRPKTWLTISFDGRPDDHLRCRPAAPGQANALENVERMLPRLLRFPRLIVTQVVAPSVAGHAADGFRYLMALGFRRFNVMPAGYVRWSSAQIESLKESFAGIAAMVKDEWRAGRPLYLRNLFVHNSQPTFANGIVADVDGSIFPSDCILADLPDEERAVLRCGSVASPPDERQLADRGGAVAGVLSRCWSDEILQSTASADAVLDSLWRALMPDFLAYRKRAGRRIQVRTSSTIHWSVVSRPMGR